MKCDEIIKSNILEKYLLNELANQKAIAFERHYFNCQRCFNEILYLNTIIESIKAGAASNAFVLKDIAEGSLAPVESESIPTLTVVYQRLHKSKLALTAGFKKQSEKLKKALFAILNSMATREFVISDKYGYHIVKEYVFDKRLSSLEEIIVVLMDLYNLESPITFIYTEK